MCSSLVSLSSTFIAQKTTMTVYTTVYLNGLEIASEIGLIDTGSDDCILPLCAIGIENASLLSPCSQTIYGISKQPVRPVGEIQNGTIVFGKSYFLNVRILVVDVPIPFLIGKSLLFHNSMNGFQINNGSIIFRRIFGQRRIDQTIPFIGVSRTLNVKPFTLKTVDAKVDWLRTNRCLSLPDTYNDEAELEAVADLLIQYEDCFGFEGTKLGTFKKQIRIPTMPGVARAQRQHPIAKQFQPMVDGEIEKMLRAGVIEPCEDPKGFNSPIIVVSRKNGKPRVCANFKNTVNRCLSDESDFWQMPDSDTIFNEIGKGNRYFASLDFKSGY